MPRFVLAPSLINIEVDRYHESPSALASDCAGRYCLRLQIEQNTESMGMQFDGTLYRDVSWGKRVRESLKVNTCWDERVLVIETEGGKMPVVERYSLSDDGARMRVVVELNGGRDDLKFLRVFNRVATAGASPALVDLPEI